MGITHTSSKAFLNRTALVFPLVRARRALEEQRHPLRRGERKEHRLVMFAIRTTYVVGPG